MRALPAALCAIGFVLGTATSAWAIAYKNPAHPFRGGDFTAGVFLESQNRPTTSDGLGDNDLKFTNLVGSYGIGVADAGLLELQLGILSGAAEGQDSASGFSYGLAYRHNLGSMGGNLQHGFLAGIHGGYAGNDTSDTYTTQIDAGYGLANALGPTSALYGGAVLSIFYGEIDIFGNQVYGFDGSSPVNLFVGMAFSSGDNLHMGAELHLIAETGFAFYVDSKF